MRKEILLSCLVGALGSLSANAQQTAPARPVIPTPVPPTAAPTAPAAAPLAPEAAPTPPAAAAPAGSPILPAQPTLPASPTLPAPPTLTTEGQGLVPGAQQGTIGAQEGALGAQQGALGQQQGALGSNVLGMTTNASVGTNQFFLTNQIFAIPDMAVTIPDQRLLIQIRTRIAPVMRTISGGTAFMPVHFLVQQNMVTVVGEVMTEPQKQEVVTVVQQTPGVVQVVDKLRVNPQLNLAGFGRGTNGAAMRFGTNFSPTGFTNGVNRVLGTNSVVPPIQPTQLPPASSQ